MGDNCLTIKLGCCTLAYASTTQLEEAIRRIAKAGYKGLDIYTGTPHLFPGDYPTEERRAVKNLIESLDLELTGFSLCGGRLGLQYNFSNPKESVRKRTTQYYKDNLELAAEIGCPLINVLTGHVLYGTSLEQGWNWTIECLQDLVGMAEEKDIILGLHPQIIGESPLMVTIDDSLKIIRELNSRIMKIIFDTAQQNITYRNFGDDIRKAADYLIYVHAADNNGIQWVHYPPGRGTVDWEGLIRALKEINFNGYISLQPFADTPVDNDSWIRESKEYMERILRKIG